MEPRFAPYQRLVIFIVCAILLSVLMFSCKTTSSVKNNVKSETYKSKEEATDNVANDAKFSISDITTDTRINRNVVFETFDSIGRLSKRVTDNYVIETSKKDKSVSQEKQSRVENSTNKENEKGVMVENSKTEKSNEVDNGFSMMVVAICICVVLIVILSLWLLIKKYL